MRNESKEADVRLIQHQTQPCPVSCVSTCLAMLKAAPADEVIEKMHLRYREKGMTMREMLDELQIPFESFDTCGHSGLEEYGAYLCTVPSLNIVGGTHQIIIEMTLDDDYHVVDPVQGRDGRKYYVKRGQASGEHEVELGGFMIDALIRRDYLERRASA